MDPILKSETMALRKRVRRYGTIGGLLTGIGGFIVFGFPMLVSTGLKSQMQITEVPNDITKSWQDVPLAITIKIHVWNIENPDEFANGAKAKLREMGPYYWNQHRWKEIISWGPNKETVKFWAIASFKFDASRTAGRLSDRITVVNVPVYAMAYVIKNLVDELPLSFAIAPVAFGFANILFMTHGEGFLKELTVGELIEGYPFTILDTIDVLTKPLTWFGIELPDTGMPENKFGLLHVKNFTKGGPYEVYTGQGSTSDKFLQYVSYQDKKTLDFYDDPKCNMMNGTDGTTMGNFLTRESTVYVFQGDACKSFHGKYKEDSSVRGIPTYRYVLPKSLFASPNINPDNKCFCRTEDYEKCDGIFDLGPCQKGAPLAFSFPHFLHASNTIRQGVEGLSPDIEKHESFFDVEPTLGAPLRAAGRLQVNILLKPMSLVAGFGGVREAVLPFVWLEESAEIDDKFETMMKLAVYPMKVIDYGSAGAVLGGIAILAGTVGYGFIKRRTLFPPKSEKDILNQEFDRTAAKQRTSGERHHYLNLPHNNARVTPPDRKSDASNSQRARFDPPAIAEHRNPAIIGINPEVMQNHSYSERMAPNAENPYIISYQSAEQLAKSYPPVYTVSQQPIENRKVAQTGPKVVEINESNNVAKNDEPTVQPQQRLSWSPPGALF